MLLILGLDGCTLDLIGPWVADGSLPNIGELMRTGAWGRLAATVPPATFPSWTTFMTGVNPGRHGVFDFTRREPGTYRVRFVNATFRKAPSVWRILSEASRRVSVLGLPGTYPPEPINGCMISGFDTPVTTRSDRSFVYPPSWADEVDRFGGFPFADFQEFRVGQGWYPRALESLLNGVKRKAALAEALLEREAWDCFMLLLGESDTVAHHFWAFHDHASPRFDPGLHSSLGDPLRRVYAVLDTVVGRLVKAAAPTQVMIVSDHGFGGVGDTAIYLNRWLAEQGYLAWRAGGAVGRLAGRLRRAALEMIPEQLQARVFRMGGGWLADALESRVRFGGIDLAQTSAFSEELNYFPSIWLNVEGRDPRGPLAATAYDETCSSLVERLQSWRDPMRGTPVVRHVWRRNELYHGPYVELAPDLVLELNTPDGYSYVCLPSGGAGPVMERMSGDALQGGKLRGMSGSHRPDGVIIVSGRGVEPGRMSGAEMADLAPTVLSLCGVAVPADCDGRILPCVTHGGYESQGSVPYELPGEVAYGLREEECIRRQLVRLGYLD